MSLIELTEEIILAIVDKKDMVAVKEFTTENENEILIQVMVDESDMPKLIGKNGKVINSVRTIVQASSYIKDNKQIKINVDSI